MDNQEYKNPQKLLMAFLDSFSQPMWILDKSGNVLMNEEAKEYKLKLKMASRKATASANPKVKKKSRFQEKLEEMQKQQQEMIKNKKK